MYRELRLIIKKTMINCYTSPQLYIQGVKAHYLVNTMIICYRSPQLYVQRAKTHYLVITMPTCAEGLAPVQHRSHWPFLI